MKKISILFLVMLAVSCAPSPEEIALLLDETLTAIPTKTPISTHTPYPTFTQPSTQTPWVVTATSSPTPKFTPTITLTPSNTPTATNTPNVAQTQTADAFAELIEKKGSGFYLVGEDIAPGSWRSSPGNDSCYWARYNRTGDILGNHFGQSGGTIYIRGTDYEVEFNGCGVWNYQGP